MFQCQLHNSLSSSSRVSMSKSFDSKRHRLHSTVIQTRFGQLTIYQKVQFEKTAAESLRPTLAEIVRSLLFRCCKIQYILHLRLVSTALSRAKLVAYQSTWIFYCALRDFLLKSRRFASKLRSRLCSFR